MADLKRSRVMYTAAVGPKIKMYFFGKMFQKLKKSLTTTNGFFFLLLLFWFLFLSSNFFKLRTFIVWYIYNIFQTSQSQSCFNNSLKLSEETQYNAISCIEFLYNSFGPVEFDGGVGRWGWWWWCNSGGPGWSRDDIWWIRILDWGARREIYWKWGAWMYFFDETNMILSNYVKWCRTGDI